MRFSIASSFLAFAALVAAQQNAINIPAGQSTLEITAGTEETITWTNPSSGTVTVKLQQEPVTPNGGIVLASSIPASAKTASFTIDPSQVNSFQYTIEIVDDTNPTNYNFSPNFGIQGATGSQTASASTASATDSSSITMTSSGSSSTATDSSSSTITDSSSSASSSASSTSDSNSSSETSAPTSAPNSNGAVKISSGAIAVVAALAVVAF